MAQTLQEQFRAARRVSTPLIAVRTQDPTATVGGLTKMQTAKDPTVPMVLWDVARGAVALNPPGSKAVQAMVGTDDPMTITNPVEMLVRAQKLPKFTILFMSNGHQYLKDINIIQAIWNLRDRFKADTRSLVMLCTNIRLPQELLQDVVVLDEPLPDTDVLGKIITEVHAAAGLQKPSAEVLSHAVDAVCGLAAFSAEQACAMSLSKSGLDMDALWERKRQQIEQTPGLSVWRGGEKFSDLGGCTNIKDFLRRVLAGENRPRAVVFIDEIEKALAGAQGDLSGTSQEMLGALLTFMQDRGSTGVVFIGPPGAAKSAMAKACGNEGQIPTISFDISGMKGSLVGESGGNMRAALGLVEAVSQGRALFIATCNSIGNLPPELRRRFSFGTFFFDLPDEEEREVIWGIYLKKYGLKNTRRPEDDGWTGAEIRQCCDLAWRLKTTLEDAAAYVVPVAKSAAEQIETLRRQAAGRFISASAPGLYEPPEQAVATARPARKIRGTD